MNTITVNKILTDKQAASLKGKFINNKHIKTLINSDVDIFDNYGNLLLKFRKNVVPYNIVELGYKSFKKSITLTDGRGITSGSSHKRIRKDGSISNITIGNKVYSGNVGYMDSNAMIKYCRLTNFGKNYFEQFKKGIPFVEHIDYLYSQLCPSHYKKQRSVADATNINYKIPNTSFTTVTVNKSFRTAVHKDSGDFRDGFGNLIVYNDNSYDGGFFVLPQYGIGVDVQTTDALFVDVHQWHGNTEMKLRNGFNKIFRISFVLYYRENMFKCKQPSEQLKELKIKKNGYLTL
tara:strand:- start:668 stop:1540 length:873 start_codon:yes stop_codon:yes gene_type:complete